MRIPDPTTKALLLVLTIGMFGLSLRPLTAETSVAAAQAPARTKQYLWGLTNIAGDWVGTSDESASHKDDTLTYSMTLDGVAQLVAKEARKGWSVHTIGGSGNGYYVLFEK